jgi:hypothetical protein
MRRPGGAILGVLAGGLLTIAGSLVPWATVRLDLTRVFALFPPDFRRQVLGLELGANLTLIAGGVTLIAGILLLAMPRHAVWLGGAALLAAGVTFMGALYHLARIRPLALEAIARASHRPVSELTDASVSPALAPFLVLAGALVAMVAGVLLASGRAGGADRGPDL